MISFPTRTERFSGLSDDELASELKAYERRVMSLRFELGSSDRYLDAVRVELMCRATELAPSSTGNE